MSGFIGGAKGKILDHINKYGLELIDFKGLDVYDYGGGIII